jgi:hypothetical protein
VHIVLGHHCFGEHSVSIFKVGRSDSKHEVVPCCYLIHTDDLAALPIGADDFDIMVKVKPLPFLAK